MYKSKVVHTSVVNMQINVGLDNWISNSNYQDDGSIPEPIDLFFFQAVISQAFC